MKILALSDVESRSLWDYFNRKKLEGIDVILSCGDLDPRYLSFLATFFHGPILYVRGNHDGIYDQIPPEGCIPLDGKVYSYQGVRFAGLGGSMRYKPGPDQYTEREMAFRALKLWFQIRRAGGVDVFVTHAPAAGIQDGRDPAHMGFHTFLTLMERFHPRYLIHGHVHLSYHPSARRISHYQDTQIINAFESYIFEL